MPSIDLYNPDAHADGWHAVRAPGGYEWWYFDAEDAATDTQFVAIFMEGFIFHPGYLRAYAQFRKRPTHVAPPLAGDFPCVYLCVYRGGRVWKQFFTQYRPDQFSAAADRCEVTIGDNRLWVNDAGDYVLTLRGTPWDLTARGPMTRVDRSLEAQLYFKPTTPALPRERAFLSREMTGAHHAWTIAAPRCAVDGMIRVGPIRGNADEVLRFDSAAGYHDHNYGTAPIGERGLRRWTWGRAMFGNRTVTFHHAEPSDRTRPAETHLVEASANETRDLDVGRVVASDWRTCRPAMFLRYPASLDFGEALRLTSPRVVEPSPFYLRLQYQAESFGERSTAFCELAYPHRVRLPILGRMIEMSFDKRALRDR